MKGVVMGKRADVRRMINRSQATRPDRMRRVLEILETGPRFSFRAHEGLFEGSESSGPSPSVVSAEQENIPSAT